MRILLAAVAGLLAAPPQEAPPNIVFILADDLGYGDLRCYNKDSKIPTPNYDRIAAEGMRFTDVHTPSSVCTPTRYGVLTGRYAWRTKLTRGVLQGYSPLLLEPGRMTVASLLRKRGYATGAVGKWHLGLGDAAQTDYAKPLRPGPLSVGFDSFFGIPASLDMPPYVFVENEGVTAPPSEQIGDSKMRRHGGGGYWRGGAIAPGFTHEGVLPRLTEKAEEFIRRQTPAKPFFLYFPLTGPHTPWMPTSEFRGKSGADWYGDFAVQVDATVGRVMKALDEKGLAANTLLIVTSDNGAHWLPEDIEKHGHRSNGALRGQKSDAWEGGHRVPFLVRWPGRVKPGATSDALVCLTDFIATAADVTGEKLPADAGEDSISFLPALRGGKSARDAIVHHSGSGLFAIRQGTWKLITGLGSGGFTPPQRAEPRPDGPAGQLYDLATDPAEASNLWLKETKTVERLTALLERTRAEGRSRP